MKCVSFFFGSPHAKFHSGVAGRSLSRSSNWTVGGETDPMLGRSMKYELLPSWSAMYYTCALDTWNWMKLDPSKFRWVQRQNRWLLTWAAASNPQIQWLCRLRPEKDCPVANASLPDDARWRMRHWKIGTQIAFTAFTFLEFHIRIHRFVVQKLSFESESMNTLEWGGGWTIYSRFIEMHPIREKMFRFFTWFNIKSSTSALVKMWACQTLPLNHDDSRL